MPCILSLAGSVFGMVDASGFCQIKLRCALDRWYHSFYPEIIPLPNNHLLGPRPSTRFDFGKTRHNFFRTLGSTVYHEFKERFFP